MLPRRRNVLLAAIAVLVLLPAVAGAGDSPREALWAAVRNGDAEAAKALLEQGTDVNAKNEIGVTALWIAASKGKAEVVELLLKRGADVNARDGIWYQTPLANALRGHNLDLVKRLLEAGARDVDDAARTAAARGNIPLLKLLLETGKVGQETLDAVLFSTPEIKTEVREALTAAGARPLPPIEAKDREAWASLAGT
jgi:ankyrin repeat protein